MEKSTAIQKKHKKMDRNNHSLHCVQDMKLISIFELFFFSSLTMRRPVNGKPGIEVFYFWWKIDILFSNYRRIFKSFVCEFWMYTQKKKWGGMCIAILCIRVMWTKWFSGLINFMKWARLKLNLTKNSVMMETFYIRLKL